MLRISAKPSDVIKNSGGVKRRYKIPIHQHYRHTTRAEVVNEIKRLADDLL